MRFAWVRTTAKIYGNFPWWSCKHEVLIGLRMDPSSPAKFLVERNCSLEHSRHVSDPWHVPLREVVVEGGRSVKHVMHVGDARHIPLRDVGVKIFCILEQVIHVCDLWYVPRPDWSMWTAKTFAFSREFDALVHESFKALSWVWGEYCGVGGRHN